MRKPTDLVAALDWWRDTVAGLRPPHVQDDPQPGWFYLRRKKGGPRIPVHIHIVQVIDPETGELAEPERVVADLEGRTIPAVRIWESVKAISLEEWAAIRRMERENERAMEATRATMDITTMTFRPPRRL